MSTAYNYLPAYPVLGLGVAGLVSLNVFQMLRVSAARKISGVEYPNLYASDAEAKADPKKMAFNCTQRAHQNTLENIPTMLAMFAYNGFYNPRFATAALLTWVFGRVFYTLNYSKGNPTARNGGLAVTAYLGLISLLGGTFYIAFTEAYKYFF